MIDGLHGLGHDGVVGGYDDDDQVGDLGTAGTHGGEGLVTGGVEEGDAAAVGELDVVGSDVLGDAAGLTCDDVGLADVVQQGGLAVVHMTHDGDDGRTLDQVCGIVHLLLYLVLCVGCDELDLIAELLGHEHQGVGVQALVDGYHQTQVHAGLDDLGDGEIHHDGQLVDSHELGHLEYPALHLLHLAGLLHLLGDEFAFLSLVLGTLGLALALGHAGVGLLDLFLDQVLVYLDTYGFGFLLIAVLLAAGGVGVFLSALFLTGTCIGLGDVHFLALDYALALAVAALLGGRMFFLEGREVYLAADHRTCELLHPGLDVLHGLAVRLLRGCLLGGLPGGRSRSGFGRCRLLGSGSRFLVEVYLAQNLESGMILTAVFRGLSDGLGGFGL